MCRPLRSLSRDIKFFWKENTHQGSRSAPILCGAASACEARRTGGALACGAGEIGDSLDDDRAVGGHVQGDVRVGCAGVDVHGHACRWTDVEATRRGWIAVLRAELDLDVDRLVLWIEHGQLLFE